MKTSLMNFAALAFALAALPAAAHTGHGIETSGYLAGLAHPFSGLDHLLMMLAVGLWSATTTQCIWRAPLVFASALLLGALFMANGADFPAIEPMIAASVLVFGLLISARVRLPESVSTVMVAGFALFHGAAHGAELGTSIALAGMVISTVLLHGTGIAAGIWLRMHNQRWQRGIGASIALTGVGLAFNLA